LSSVDPHGSCLCSCVYRLDHSDLRFSSSATVVVLVRWSYGALARRLPDCLLQQGLPGSNEGGAKTAARLRLALVLVVVGRWSMDLDVFFFTSGVLCTTLTVDESYPRKKREYIGLKTYQCTEFLCLLVYISTLL
jgi:hypothetical protein